MLLSLRTFVALARLAVLSTARTARLKAKTRSYVDENQTAGVIMCVRRFLQRAFVAKALNRQ
jgi:hypothetical protein